ncbi:MAG: hypothetical protein IJK01_00820 [Clostridia bacterium]|nr:hypothetical protein [Clostridia bacterium]
MNPKTRKEYGQQHRRNRQQARRGIGSIFDFMIMFRLHVPIVANRNHLFSANGAFYMAKVSVGIRKDSRATASMCPDSAIVRQNHLAHIGLVCYNFLEYIHVTGGAMTQIIAFEGIDGTGKTVQMQQLSNFLKNKGKTVKEFSFPIYDSFFGSYVGRYLTAKDGIPANTVDGKSMALWFALDRWEAFRKSDDLSYDYILINRYVLSNAVYQSIRDCDLGKPDILDFVLELEFEHFGIPRPTLTLVLDMDLAEAAENVGKKGFREYVGNERDVYESIDSIQLRARKKYQEYAERLDHVVFIPCMKDGKLDTIEHIAEKIQTAVLPLL